MSANLKTKSAHLFSMFANLFSMSAHLETKPAHLLSMSAHFLNGIAIFFYGSVLNCAITILYEDFTVAHSGNKGEWKKIFGSVIIDLIIYYFVR